MQLPFLEISNESELYTVLSSDGAEQFLIKPQPFFSSGLAQLENNNVSLKNINPIIEPVIEDFFYSIFTDVDNKKQTFILSHNVVHPTVQSWIYILRIMLGNSEAESFGKVAGLLNYLLLANTLQTSLIQIDISNCILQEHKSQIEIIEYINSILNTEDSIIFKPHKDQLSTLIAKKIQYKTCNIFSSGMILETLKEECDNIYYGIEIYGNRNYILYNPMIQEIEDLTGVVIEKPYCKFIGEYNNVIQSCQS